MVTDNDAHCLYSSMQVNSNECDDQNKELSPVESSQLGLPNFAGVFLVLGTMLAFGFAVLIAEMIVGAYQASKENQV